MTSAYDDALSLASQSLANFTMSKKQMNQAIQFRALDIEIDRAEMDLAIREVSGDWPNYHSVDDERYI